MPRTLTLKNIPDLLYDRLRLSAQEHRRSMNSEALVCLEAALTPTAMDPAAHRAIARALRDKLAPRKFSAREIDKSKREGRE
jgi:antitoxin FitA